MTTIQVMERPIMFQGDMVRAILDGRKSMTRRVIKLKEFGISDTKGYDFHFRDKEMRWHDYRYDDFMKRQCPYGVPGDRLFVQEECVIMKGNHMHHRTLEDALTKGPSKDLVFYPATENIYKGEKKISPINMPRWASRITLENKHVQIERVQDITVEDCLKEGINIQDHKCGCDICSTTSILCPATQSGVFTEFKELWDSIYEKDGYGWDVNSWVRVISFKRIQEGGRTTC